MNLPNDLSIIKGPKAILSIIAVVAITAGLGIISKQASLKRNDTHEGLENHTTLEVPDPESVITPSTKTEAYRTSRSSAYWDNLSQELEELSFGGILDPSGNEPQFVSGGYGSYPESPTDQLQGSYSHLLDGSSTSSGSSPLESLTVDDMFFEYAANGAANTSADSSPISSNSSSNRSSRSSSGRSSSSSSSSASSSQNRTSRASSKVSGLTTEYQFQDTGNVDSEKKAIETGLYSNDIWDHPNGSRQDDASYDESFYMGGEMIGSLDESGLVSSGRSSSKGPFRCMFTRSQDVISGQRVSVRVLEDISLGGITIPTNTHLQGICSLSDRLGIRISSVLIRGKIVPLQLEAYDNDGVKGLLVSLGDSGKEDILSRGLSSAEAELGSRMGRFAREVLSEGVSLVKGKRESSTVRLPSGYQFLLVDTSTESASR